MKLQRLQNYLFFRMPQAGLRADVPLERRENTKKSSSFENKAGAFLKGRQALYMIPAVGVEPTLP
ncbi:hypothetical protein [Planococcus koreensis]|uniref:hypothetical protein n=1 Tax=Planococcus koreensis TaxID=112331 RepID=UPI00108059E7|nr:hypothetical protein [Planococcus koreensis]